MRSPELSGAVKPAEDQLLGPTARLPEPKITWGQSGEVIGALFRTFVQEFVPGPVLSKIAGSTVLPLPGRNFSAEKRSVLGEAVLPPAGVTAAGPAAISAFLPLPYLPGASTGIGPMKSSLSRYGRAAQIDQIDRNSAAEKAGLKAGDKILYADNRNITEGSDLISVLRDKNPGDPLTLEISRSGKRQKVSLTLDQPYGRLGILGRDPAPAENLSGVMVIDADQNICSAGIKRKELITKVDGRPVGSLNELTAQIESHRIGERIKLTVEGKAGVREIEIALGGKPARTEQTKFGEHGQWRYL